MKQLLSISKQRKPKIAPIKQLLTKSPQQNQQDNFIYQQQSPNPSPNPYSNPYNDSNEPSENEIRAYAEVLGIKLPEEEDFLYIAKECLNQPMPKDWRCQEDQMGEIVYVNQKTGEVSFQHPCDQIYRWKVINQRKKKIKDVKKAIPKINIQKSKTSFVENVFQDKSSREEKNQISEPDRSQPSKQKKSKDLGAVISSNINNQPFLYDDDDEPTNPVQIHKRSKNQNNNLSDPQVKQHSNPIPKNTRTPQSQSPPPAKPKLFKKNSNPSLLLTKRQQIEQKLHKKYEQMNKQLQQKYIQKLNQMKNKQNHYRNASEDEIKDIIGMEKIDKRKKEIQMKLMLEYSKAIEKKRMEQDRKYQNDILGLSSRYQIQQLFTEMAECRKFLTSSKEEKDKMGNFQEMERNMRVISQIETGKMVAEIEGESRILMHTMLNKIIKQKRDFQLSWQKQAEARQKFEQGLQKIIQRIKIKNDVEGVGQIDIQRLNSYNQQQKLNEEGQKIYQQLQKLKKKLKDLKQDNNTQRSNLSEKQSKLVDLLQSRAGSSSSRSQYR